jgi:ATP-dependent Clp protease ATP-binding subunit ClpC
MDTEFEEQGGGRRLPMKKSKNDSRTPVLDNFSRDLIKLAEQGKLDPVIGREKEINRIAQILSRRKKNNPIVIGEPGSGKTAIVEGLAIKIHQGDCPKNLADKRIVSLDLTSVVAGTKYRGQFEERLKAILEELVDNDNVVVFIDEIHTIIGTGNSSGSLDASNIIKPALSRGEIQCIGATTLDEYRENIEKDGALERRFQKVLVDPATTEETMIILSNIKSKYENHHKVKYSEESLEACVTLSDRYITDRELPDKAIDILDEVGAKAQIDVKLPEFIEDLKLQVAEIKRKKLDVVKTQNYEIAAELRDQEKKLINKLTTEKEEWEQKQNENRTLITEDDVYKIVSDMTNIPVTRLDSDEAKSLLNLEKTLKANVIGQDDAVTKISKAIRRNRVGIKEPNRPIGSFIFLGSTGVGKTHLAKTLAREIFGDESAMIRVDMSELMEKHSVSRLVGSPPGYVGHDEGGQLTEQVKNKPYSVILFDEIEKAHRDVFNILLQVLDEGHLTDGLGRKINFKNTLIIMTSNVGARKLQDFGTGLGFSTDSRVSQHEELTKGVIQKALKAEFSPEFLNRLDDIVVFKALEKENIGKIVKIEMNKLSKRIVERGYNISFGPSIIDFIADKGFDAKYGARPIRRAIQEYIEDFIAEEVLGKGIVEGKSYSLKINKDSEKISVTEKKS